MKKKMMEKKLMDEIVEKIEGFLDKKGLNTENKYDLFLRLYESAKQDKLDLLEEGQEEEELDDGFENEDFGNEVSKDEEEYVESDDEEAASITEQDLPKAKVQPQVSKPQPQSLVKQIRVKRRPKIPIKEDFE